MVKLCTKCGNHKEMDCFGKDRKAKDGKFYWCRECVKTHSKAYYKNNTLKCRSSSLSIYHRNAKGDDFRDRRNARQRAYSKDYTKRPSTRLKAREWTRRYLQKIEAHISRKMSFQVWYSLRLILDKSKKKNGKHWQDLVGYSVEQLMEQLESKFQIGMTWENYGGQTGWQIDHVTPKSWFDIQEAGDDEFRKCWALENLQPLWLKDNASKGARFSG